MPEQREASQNIEIGPPAFPLAATPIPKLKGLNEIRFAVWEMLDACFPWKESVLNYQARPALDSSADQRDDFIRLQINAHNRDSLLIWHKKMMPLSKYDDDNNEWTWAQEKLKQIELAYLNKDELATVEGLCKPYTKGRSWPLRGNPERWRLYAALFNRLMLNPPPSLCLETELPVSNLVQAFEHWNRQIQEPLQAFAQFAQRTQETILHGRELSEEERIVKRKLEEKRREQYEMERYGRVLSLQERKQAIRKEQIEEAEEATHQAQLRALEAERWEADQRARAPMERMRTPRAGHHPALPVAVLATSTDTAPLQPGQKRTLEALKNAPEGLTVKQLAPLTRKDAMAEETPEDSLRVWLNDLKGLGLARSEGRKTKTWFYVQGL